jgi:hypothetical protein
VGISPDFSDFEKMDVKIGATRNIRHSNTRFKNNYEKHIMIILKKM